MKDDSSKRSVRLGKFVTSVYGVYFPGEHSHFGANADHIPVIPGNDFAPEVSSSEGFELQNPADGNMASGRSSIVD